MSFEPVTMWRLRCNGDTTRGQCPTTYRYYDYDAGEDEEVEALFEKTHLAAATARSLEAGGWSVTGPADAPRVLCPGHVAAATYLAAAEIDGLPFTHHEKEPPR